MQKSHHTPIELKYREKQQEFKKEFATSFFTCINDTNAVAVGRATATVEYTMSESVAKFILTNALANVAGGIPLIGPFAATFISEVPSAIYENMKLNKLTNEAEELNSKFVEYGTNKMEEIVEEVGQEISRIFEYQIAVLNNVTEAAKLGRFAATKIYESAANSSTKQRLNFDRNSLINALLFLENEAFLTKITLKIIGGNNIETLIPVSKDKTGKYISWNCVDIFLKVGVMVERAGGQYQYYNDPKNGNKIPKCGFRSYAFTWDNKSNKYELSEHDKSFNALIPVEEIQRCDYILSYRPYHRLVNQDQLDKFLAVAAESIKPKSFSHFIREQSSAFQDIRPVLRLAQLPSGKDITFADFSSADMTRHYITDCKSIQCIYNETRLASSIITNTVMKNSWFMSADLRGSVFKNVDLSGENSLTKANFKNAFFDPETDLTDNYSFGQAITEHALVLTTRVLFTATEKIQNLESMMSKLVEAKAKKEEELTEKLLKIENEMEKLKNRRIMSNNSDLPCFYNVRDAVDDFSGREDVLTKLTEFFDGHEQSYAISVIAAGGGIGKTQLILEYVFRNKEKYGPDNFERVFWVAAETIESLTASFKYFAEALNINTENRTDKAILKDIQKKLSTKIPQTLFIFDNVDNLKLVKDYFPQSTTKHHIIITSRLLDNWPEEYQVMKLQPFSATETHDYISSQIDDVNEEDILKLTELFNNVPLALSQAIAHTKEYGLSLREYLQCFHRLEKMSENDRSLYITIILSLEELEGKYSKAIDIMKICGYLYAEGIPIKIFQSLFESEEELNRSILILEDNNLIKRKIDSDGVWKIFIHRLVQDVMKEKVEKLCQTNNILIQASEFVFSCMASFTCYDTKELLTKNEAMLPYAMSLIHHYEALEKASFKIQGKSLTQQEIYLLSCAIIPLQLSCVRLYLSSSRVNESVALIEKCLSVLESYTLRKNQVLTALVLYQCGACRYTQCQYENALKFLEESKQLNETLYGHIHSNVADCISYIASIHSDQGAHEKALQHYDEAFSIYEEVFGRDHVGVADCISKKSYVFSKLGQYEKAMEMCNEALAIRVKLFGTNHSDVGSSYISIGNIYSELVQLDKAMEMYQNALNIFTTLFGKNHANVATSICNIANIYVRKGIFEKALEMHQEGLTIYETIYGHDHASVAECIDCIAYVYSTQGVYDKAMEMYTDTLRIYEEIFGHNHASVASSMDSIANIHRKLNNIDKALELYKESQRIREGIYGHNHKDVAESINNTAIVYYSQGVYDKSLELFSEALRIHESVYGHNHSSVATLLANIASIHVQRAQFDKGIELYNECLQIRLKLYDRDHADIADVIHSLGEICLKKGLRKEAMERFNEALPIFEKVYGHNHSTVVACLQGIADIYQALGDREKAIEITLETIQINRVIFGDKHTTIARGMAVIANIYSQMGENDDAMKLVIEAKNIYEEVYGKEHSTVATCHCTIANIHYSLKAYEAAMGEYLEARRVYEAIYGRNHFDVATVMSNAANILCDIGDFDRAILLYEEAMDICENVFGHNHPNVGLICDNIATLYRDKGALDKAEEYYLIELKIFIELYGPDDDNVNCVVADMQKLGLKPDPKLFKRDAQQSTSARATATATATASEPAACCIIN